MHFGADIHTEVEPNDIGEDYLHIHHEDGNSLEGHWFLTVSLNYVIADLLKKK